MCLSQITSTGQLKPSPIFIRNAGRLNYSSNGSSRILKKNQNIYRQLQACWADLNTGGIMRLFVDRVYEVPIETLTEHAADYSINACQFIQKA